MTRWRPTPVVGAVLLGVILGAGVTGAAAVAADSGAPRGDHGIHQVMQQQSGPQNWPGPSHRR